MTIGTVDWGSSRHFRFTYRKFRRKTHRDPREVGSSRILLSELPIELSEVPIGTFGLRIPETPKNLVLGGSLIETADGHTATFGMWYRNCRWTYWHCRAENPRDLPNLGPLGNPNRNCRLNYWYFRSPVPELPTTVSALPVQFSQRPKT